jgi:hypothetical protein
MLSKSVKFQSTLAKTATRSFWGSTAAPADTNVISNDPPKRIAVTGAAGNIAYSILFRIASGEFLGKGQRVIIHLVDLPFA